MLWVAGVLLTLSQPRAGAADAVITLSAAQVRAAGITTSQALTATSLAAGNSAGGLRLVGRVIAPGNSNGVVLAAVSGQVEAVFVQVGSTVRAGQPLARIGSTELPALQSEFLQARSASELAATRLARDEALYADGTISESRLRETRSARQVALASEQEQRNRLRQAGYGDAGIGSITPASITATVTLRAPAAGTLLQQAVAPGQHVERGTVLFRLSGARGLWLDLDAPVRQTARIQVGDTVTVPACEGRGRIIAVGSLLDAASQTAVVRAELDDDPPGCVRLNQYVEADVHPAAAPAGLVSVPATALVRNADRDFVFRQQDGGYVPVPVEVERRLGDIVWLRGGLVPGAYVATGGITALKGAWLGFGPVSGAGPQ